MMITANGFAQGVIDVHSHIITPEFLSALESEGRSMDEGFPLPKYDAEAHLRWMDEAGVQTSVLTLAAPQPTSVKVVRQTNEAAVKLKQEYPGRFLFCAVLPLPNVDAAVREAMTPVMQKNKMVGSIDYEANLGTLYYDLAGAHSPEVIRTLLTITTPDHLLYGSDYPYVAPQVLTQSLQRMQQYLATEPDLTPFREMILHKNAERLFGPK